MNPGVQQPYADRFDELRRFVRLDEADLETLRRLRIHAEPHFDEIARRFYERTREHEDAHAVFRNEAQIKRLHRSMVEWLRRVLTGPYDANYVAQTTAIGRRHVQVGLPMRYVFGAMTLFRTELSRLAIEHGGEDMPRALEALNRVLDLELAIMSLTYTEAEARRRERLIRHDTASQPVLCQNAVNLVDGAVIVLDPDGRIVLFNAGAQRLTGYSADEVLGEALATVSAPPDGDLADAIERARELDEGEAIPLEPSVHVQTRRGTFRQLAGRIYRRKNDPNLYLVGRDVTARMAVEARLRRSERLAAIGTLAAGLAHEIRNPLNGAQLHMTFIQRGLQQIDDAEELHTAAEVVTGEIRRLGELVSEFLDFARPHALRRVPTVLQTLCKRCTDLVQSEAHAAGVQLSFLLPAAQLTAEVDTGRLEQVLLNLLRNAVEASPNGGHVVLELLRRPHEARFRVLDEGPGLDDDAPIWDPFFSTKDKGTGLGLAIAHRIVTDHGGSVGYEREHGHTVFFFDIPLADPEKPPLSVPIEYDD
jgi:PAS domain S-box-containing protein